MENVACPNCNKNDTVTIGQKNYCTNCGTAISAGSAGNVSDIVARPSTPAPAPTPAAASVAQPKPAQQFHGAPSGRSSVLDLRSAPQPTPAPVAAAPITPAPAVYAPVAKKEARLANATSTARSDMVQKFPSSAPVSSPAATAVPPTSTPIAAPAVAPAVSSYQPAATSMPAANPLKPQIATPNIAGSAMPAPVAAPAIAPVGPTPMPNQVASQINAMQNLISAETLSQIDPTSARKEAFKMAMSESKPAPEPKGGPRALSVAAAAFAVLIMGGYIWLQNYPKLAIRVAGNKAGIQASIPVYVPSSYNLSGPITYSPGQITLTFTSTGSNNRLTIAERKTQWDSSSLLENYVSRKTKDYLAVQNQGLTIYLYGGNQASWVNRGIWYSIEGDTQISREQVLKIASSL